VLDSTLEVRQHACVARRLVARVLVVAVQFSAITAPLAHVHLDDNDTSHHHGRETHAHIVGHSGHAGTVARGLGDGPAMIDHDGDERIIDVPFYLIVRPDVPQIVAALPVASVVVVLEAAPTSRVPQVAHGPDPPSRVASPPRAPPAFLSLI
jgi:hypothetical protein